MPKGYEKDIFEVLRMSLNFHKTKQVYRALLLSYLTTDKAFENTQKSDNEITNVDEPIVGTGYSVLRCISRRKNVHSVKSATTILMLWPLNHFSDILGRKGFAM